MKFVAVMKKEDLILDCRYYNGEEEVPDSLPPEKAIFRDYERVWVMWVLDGYECLQDDINYFTEVYDLPHLLPDDDGTPLGLKALLFNRYDHWVGIYGSQSREDYALKFKGWYIGEYIGSTKTHRQLINH